MAINLGFNLFQSIFQMASASSGRVCQSPDLPDWPQDRANLGAFAALNQISRAQDYSQQTALIWASLLQPAATPLNGPQELQRDSELAVGPDLVQVDDKGVMTVSRRPSQLNVDGVWAGSRECGQFHSSQQIGGGQLFRFENGSVTLPTGKKLPYNLTGCVIVFEGREYGAGRNSKDSSQNIRCATAEEGQQIPVNPPGHTTVYYIGANFEVEGQEVR
ncbi:hypothetical protein IV102_14705 [bacterium]|nr:hypothetical protein [bacterium]